MLLVQLARTRPHRYALMFDTPPASADAARAAGRLQDQYLAVMASVVGDDAARRYGALVLSAVHGMAVLELGGQLDASKWTVDADQLVRMLVSALRGDAARIGQD